jgi:hypothetical protein
MAAVGSIPFLALAARALPDGCWWGSLGVFGITCWPLLRRAAHTDRALLPWIVPLSFLRAMAQGLGLARGLVCMVLRTR